MRITQALRTIGLAAALVGTAAEAKIVTETVKYKQADTELQGYLIYDDAAAGAAKRPGVLVFPEWWGLNDFAKDQAAVSLSWATSLPRPICMAAARPRPTRTRPRAWPASFIKTRALSPC